MGRLTLKEIVDKKLLKVQQRIDTRMKENQGEAASPDLLEHKKSLLRIKRRIKWDLGEK